MEADPGEMKIDVVSDVVCPWCFVGKRRLEAALATFEEILLVAAFCCSIEAATPDA